jgi:hypothetical protein
VERIAVRRLLIAAECTRGKRCVEDMPSPVVVRECIAAQAVRKDVRLLPLIVGRNEDLVTRADLVVDRWDRRWLSFHRLG